MTGKKVLLADDEEDVRLVVSMHLESQGYTVLTAYDGLDAISIAEREIPDLILLDVMMPVMSGLEAARKLRSGEKTAKIPILMLSAASQSDSVKKGIEAGATDYIVKPFDPAALE